MSDDELGQVAGAIAGLDPDDKAHFTKSGKPDAKALSEVVGFSVSAKARDAAWSAYQAVKAAAAPAAGSGPAGAAGGAPAGSLV